MIQRLATETTKFITAAKGFNGTVTQALERHSEVLGSHDEMIRRHDEMMQRHDEMIERLDRMVTRFDEWLRGQGPKTDVTDDRRLVESVSRAHCQKSCCLLAQRLFIALRRQLPAQKLT
jgi:hypothetical protein